jgi:hypothetical protein
MTEKYRERQTEINDGLAIEDEAAMEVAPPASVGAFSAAVRSEAAPLATNYRNSGNAPVRRLDRKDARASSARARNNPD